MNTPINIVLLDDADSLGGQLTLVLNKLKTSADLPKNLELVHFTTSAALKTWLQDRDNRESIGFFIIDKNLDIVSASGEQVFTENGLIRFDSMRTEFESDLKPIDYAVFSADLSLTPDEVQAYLDDDLENIKLLHKPNFGESGEKTYHQLLAIMLNSDKFWASVKKINGHWGEEVFREAI